VAQPKSTTKKRPAAKRAAAKKSAAKRAPAKRTSAAKKAPATKSTAKTAAKKSAAKKTTTKTAAKKSAAKKSAKTTPAKKAPAKKAPAKKAAQKTSAKKAPAKKSPASKAQAKKATAKKAPAKKTATMKAPAKKTPAKKTPAKKTPAKKTPAKKAGRSTSPTRDLVVLPDERPWTEKELDEVRGQLEADRDRFRLEVSSVEQGIQDLLRAGGDGAGNDQADVGSTSLERDSEMSLANNTRDMLIQTERALERLEDRTYGICESCGNPIGKRRLMVFPRATLCMTCKQREERR
jgi:RNA polymerase-binding protein DksA